MFGSLFNLRKTIVAILFNLLALNFTWAQHEPPGSLIGEPSNLPWWHDSDDHYSPTREELKAIFEYFRNYENPKSGIPMVVQQNLWLDANEPAEPKVRYSTNADKFDSRFSPLLNAFVAVPDKVGLKKLADIIISRLDNVIIPSNDLIEASTGWLEPYLSVLNYYSKGNGNYDAKWDSVTPYARPKNYTQRDFLEDILQKMTVTQLNVAVALADIYLNFIPEYYEQIKNWRPGFNLNQIIDYMVFEGREPVNLLAHVLHPERSEIRRNYQEHSTPYFSQEIPIKFYTRSRRNYYYYIPTDVWTNPGKIIGDIVQFRIFKNQRSKNEFSLVSCVKSLQ